MGDGVKRADIEAIMEAGGAAAVQYPRDEAGTNRYSSKAIVKATPLEVGVTRERSSRADGVRCRLEEPLRVMSGDPAGWGEIPVGHEFVCASADVLRAWGGPGATFTASIGQARLGDEERSTMRRLRYEEQDYIRERLPTLGITVAGEKFNMAGEAQLKGGEVVIERGPLVELLRKLEAAGVTF